MITKEYAFHAPKSLDEVLSLLQQHGDDAKILAGGMSLVPVMTLGLLQPEVVISLNHVPGLDYVRDDGSMLKIGALTRSETVRPHPLVKEHCPLFAEAAGCVGDVQIRHRGTIGGCIAHADPAADYLPVTLAVGAQFKLQRAKGERTVKATEFYKDLMQTTLGTDELLTEVQVPKLGKGSGSSYQRLHRVEGNFAIVTAAAVIEKGFATARLGIGGIGPIPVLVDVSKRLKKGVNAAALCGVAEDVHAASGDAYGDLNGDAEYRRAMAQVFAKRTIQTAAAQVQ